MTELKYFSPKCYADVVLSLSLKMKSSVLTQDWETIQELEQKRHIIIEQLFSHPEIEEALPSLVNILEQVMEIDALVISEGESNLKAMSNQLNHFGKGKRAVSAYLNP